MFIKGNFDAFAAYSGGVVSTQGGIFKVNDKIMEDCTSGRLFKHPAILGAQISNENQNKQENHLISLILQM